MRLSLELKIWLNFMEFDFREIFIVRVFDVVLCLVLLVYFVNFELIKGGGLFYFLEFMNFLFYFWLKCFGLIKILFIFGYYHFKCYIEYLKFHRRIFDIHLNFNSFY